MTGYNNFWGRISLFCTLFRPKQMDHPSCYKESASVTISGKELIMMKGSFYLRLNSLLPTHPRCINGSYLHQELRYQSFFSSRSITVLTHGKYHFLSQHVAFPCQQWKPVIKNNWLSNTSLIKVSLLQGHKRSCFLCGGHPSRLGSMASMTEYIIYRYVSFEVHLLNCSYN